MTDKMKQLAIALALAVAPAAQAATLTPLYSFQGGTDGVAPTGVIYANGMLYGTTLQGGMANCFGYGCGTVFAINLATNTETVLYSFTNGADGYYPQGQLMYVNGILYGTTTFGAGSGCFGNGCGTIYAIDTTTGTQTTLYTFAGGGDAGLPWAGLATDGSVFYGTSVEGGNSDAGTVFTFNPTTNAESVLYSFGEGHDGNAPEGALTFANGTLYGTTPAGGKFAGGTAFEVNPSTGAEKVLYSFNAKSGDTPEAGLIFAGQSLYGVNFWGGKCGSGGGCGTVFSLNPSGKKAATLYTMQGGNGGLNPNAPLVSQGGLYYGTTLNGGGSAACTEGCGTIFVVDPAKKKASAVIYAFTGGSDGAAPSNGGLVYENGVFYGTALGGGANGDGVVYMVSP